MNVLLPLRSIPWPFDGPRTRVAAGTTDLFGCHGTSGSGVLQENAQGELELLGPAVGGPGWSTEFLCNTSSSFSQGDQSLTYASNGALLELVAEHSEGENDLDEDRDRGSCGCQNVGIGQICQPAVDLCSEGFSPRCDPQQGDFPVVACGYCYCD